MVPLLTLWAREPGLGHTSRRNRDSEPGDIVKAFISADSPRDQRVTSTAAQHKPLDISP